MAAIFGDLHQPSGTVQRLLRRGSTQGNRIKFQYKFELRIYPGVRELAPAFNRHPSTV